jgi:hypothetical protein
MRGGNPVQKVAAMAEQREVADQGGNVLRRQLAGNALAGVDSLLVNT